MSYIALEQLKTYLDITGDENDDMLIDMIAAAQKAIEAHTLRRFEATEPTTHYLARVSGTRLWLDDDLCEVISVVNGDGVDVSGSVVACPRNGAPWFALDLRPASGVAWDTLSGEIAVRGLWAASESAPEHVQQACLILAAYLYRRKDNAVDGDRAILTTGNVVLPMAMPGDVRALLAGEVRR